MTYIFLSLLVAISTFQLRAPTENSTPSADEFEKNIYIWSGTLSEVMNLVNQKYYQTIDAKKAMIKAINAFVSLDPHSQLLDPDSYKQILETTQGEFSGIGIVIDNLKEADDEFLRIIDTVPAGPSDKAGILPGDNIVQIENETLRGMTVEEAVAKLKGKKGTTVNIKIARKGSTKLLSFAIKRDTVEVQQATAYYFKDHNIYYLALTMFTENSVKQVENLLKKSQTNQSKGLILDLRNNSGGLLNSVVDIAGLFLPQDSLVVVTKDKSEKILEEYKTTREPVDMKPMPIFILVNNYTASAAEILAGALKIHSEKLTQEGSVLFNVFLVGTRTFGKGSVQEVIPLTNDAALKMTTALYYLPDSVSIQGKGINPDFEIEAMRPLSDETKWFNEFFGRESTLKNSIKTDNKSEEEKNNKAKPEEEKTWQERKQEQISQDYQIINTIRMIELLDCARRAMPSKLVTRKDTVEFLQKSYNPSGAIEVEEIKL